IVIGRGRLIAETSIEDFLAGGDGSFVQARLTEAETLAVLLRARGVSVARQGPDLLRISGADAATVGEIARTEGLALLELSTQQATLEQRYMELTGDSVDYGTAGPSDVLAPNRN
ncbi:MAG TPA: ABC transporter ATP-binding protein, partial [Streptosporangiaceae bacterium]|nr:ABC transporter ATP-binding protein [Streptosporangiaceae bacterium]